MRRLLTPAIIGVLGLSQAAGADIIFGPWTFHDDAFADDATQIDAGTISLWGGATDLDDALTGFSPDKQIVNIGFDTNANHFQLDFIDLLAVDDAGADIVFFDARFSADPYEIALRPQGGSFTAFMSFTIDVFIDSGVDTAVGSADIYGLEIDASDFGLAAGAVIDAIQFRALPDANGTIQGDPVMAGVLNFAIPAPPAAALLGLAGLAGGRRRPR